MTIKIYLDDERPTPPGWTRCFWPQAVINILMTNEVEEISLDHDLGNDEIGTGYDVLQWIEEQVALNQYHAPKIRVHSANPAARQRMEQAIRSIQRLEQQQ